MERFYPVTCSINSIRHQCRKTTAPAACLPARLPVCLYKMNSLLLWCLVFRSFVHLRSKFYLGSAILNGRKPKSCWGRVINFKLGSVAQSICLIAYLHTCLYYHLACLSMCILACLLACLSACLSDCLSAYMKLTSLVSSFPSFYTPKK